MRRIAWKAGARCAVSIGIDVDGESLWLSKDPENERRPGVLSQGAYGPKVGLPLLLEMLERHALRATFFVPGWVAERYPEVIARAHRMGHEVAHHGYCHEWPDPDDPRGEEARFVRGLEALEHVTGQRPVGFRSPAWELTPRTLPLLREHGMLYSSNLMDDLAPYIHDEGIVELPVQWLLDDAPYFMFQTRVPSRPIWPAEHVERAWLEEFHGLYRLGGYFNLTLHPQFIGRPGRLAMLERVLSRISTYPDVWFASLRDVATYWRDTHG
ncbi:MAG: polysaccharide deacetylase [Trueperaceae bacterium]|nr:MAG: polysaccharide deacetylase [Trueperaceae bacterium]